MKRRAQYAISVFAFCFAFAFRCRRALSILRALFLLFEGPHSRNSRHVGDTEAAAAKKGNTKTWAEKDLNDEELKIGWLAVTS